MALRGFGTQTLSGTAQPAFGTTLSASSNQPSPDVFTGQLDPRSRPSSLVLTVTNINLFRKGDKIQVGTAANFLLTATTGADSGQVTAVNTGSSQITVSGLTRAHAAGEFVVLGIQAARIRVLANANPIYVGEDSSVAANSTSLADILLPGASYDLGPSAPGNIYGTSHYWFLGTAADTYIASIVTV